jgi:predicted RNase H-like HicB family nuclease
VEPRTDITVHVRGRDYRVVLTPDPDVGGYTIEVPELPGCLSEGDAMAEAREMAAEAIDAWLAAAADAD